MEHHPIYIDDDKLDITLRRLTTNGVFQELHVEPKPPHVIHDMFVFMADYFPKFANILEEYQDENISYKLHARMEVGFIKFDAEGKIINQIRTWLITYAVDCEGDYKLLMNKFSNDLSYEYGIFNSGGSGWVFDRMYQFDINRAKYRLATTKNLGLADKPPKLPPHVRLSSVVSIERHILTPAKNIGENCFVDAVSIAGFLATRDDTFTMPLHRHRPVVWQKLMQECNYSLNFCSTLRSVDGVDFKDCYRFENDNPDYFITIVGTDGADGFCALRRFKYTQYKAMLSQGRTPIIIHILLHNQHYYAVKNIDCLLCPRSSRRYLCYFCHQYFRSNDIRHTHMETCDTTFIRRVSMPKEHTFINFEKYQHACQHHPFVIYADSECYHEKSQPQQKLAGEPASKKMKSVATTVIDRHVPCMIGYYLAITPKFSNILFKLSETSSLLPEFPHKLYKEFRGVNCVNDFLDSLVDITERLAQLFRFHNQGMKDSELDKAFNDNQSFCCICNKEGFNSEDDSLRKVFDHDHWTGEYRGPAHNACNLKVRQQRRFFPVFFHNFRGYDCHLICKYAKFQNVRQFNLFPIALTSEKYLSLSLKWKVDSYETKDGKTYNLFNEIRFLDSFQFISAGLGSLIEQLAQNNDDNLFRHLRKNVADYNTLFQIVKRKGVYPYTYIDSLERLDERQLPAQKEFEGGLNTTGCISTDEYAYAQSVWQKTHCENLWDYTSFYMKIDILGLADVFEKFRVDCLDSYGLDPVFSYSLPGFAWASMLRKTQVDLEQMSDYEMFCFFEQGIRGGLTQASVHYEKADNHYTNSEKTPEELSRFLYLFDANSLYSWAMAQPLPFGNLEWVAESDLSVLFPLDFSSWPSLSGEEGYTLLVDLKYPKHLHEKTASYPLAAAHESVESGDFSITMLLQYMKLHMDKKSIPSEHKLMASCRDKVNYVVHYRTLHFYLTMGLELTSVKAAVKFQQKPFMKGYIDFNIEQRKKNSGDKIKSDLFKKLNNAVFGKTQQQDRKHINFKLESDKMKQMKLVGKPTYKGSVVFQKDLVGFYMMQDNLTLHQPIYVGQAILDLSKLLMYSFYYTVIMPAFKDVSVVYTDTDSLLLNICDTEVERKLGELKNSWIDGSNMAPTHPLYITENKGKLGYFKDEMEGVPILEVVCLRPKMYAIKSVTQQVKKTAKGVKKEIVKRQFGFDDYFRVYAEGEKEGESVIHYIQQQNFRSVRHAIETIEQKKKGLTLFDNKRFWISNRQSLPFGHFAVEEMQKETREARRDVLLTKYNVDIESSELDRKRKRQMLPYRYPDEMNHINNQGRLFDKLKTL